MTLGHQDEESHAYDKVGTDLHYIREQAFFFRPRAR
jgi:hypothetical protein